MLKNKTFSTLFHLYLFQLLFEYCFFLISYNIRSIIRFKNQYKFNFSQWCEYLNSKPITTSNFSTISEKFLKPIWRNEYCQIPLLRLQIWKWFNEVAVSHYTLHSNDPQTHSHYVQRRILCRTFLMSPQSSSRRSKKD